VKSVMHGLLLFGSGGDGFLSSIESFFVESALNC